MTLAAHDPTVHSAYRFGALALLLAAGSILGALAFEHLGGYGAVRTVPAAALRLLRWAFRCCFWPSSALSAGQPRAAAIVFVIVALAFLANAALGVYHAGVEWQFWAGPAACTGVASADHQRRQYARSVATDERRALRPGGVASRRPVASPGWNVVVSLLVVLLSIRATTEALHAR